MAALCESVLTNSLYCVRTEGHRGAHEDVQGHTNAWYRAHPLVHRAGIKHLRNIPTRDSFTVFWDEVTCLFCMKK